MRDCQELLWAALPELDARYLRVITLEDKLTIHDNRNYTAHDYGEGFAETTLKLLPNFIDDAKALAGVIEGTVDG